MIRIKIRFNGREDNRIIADVMKRGEVVGLPELAFIVPEPAIAFLDEAGANYENLGAESWDRVVHALRSAPASTT